MTEVPALVVPPVPGTIGSLVAVTEWTVGHAGCEALTARFRTAPEAGQAATGFERLEHWTHQDDTSACTTLTCGDTKGHLTYVRSAERPTSHARIVAPPGNPHPVNLRHFERVAR